MKGLEEQFVPYEEALALKELGFDEECIGLFSQMITVKKVGGKLTHTIDEPRVIDFSTGFNPMRNSSYSVSNHLDTITTPLYQQAFRWFEAEHSIFINRVIDTNPNEILNITYRLKSFRFPPIEVEFDELYGSFDRDKANLTCLRKLIEIIKKK